MAPALAADRRARERIEPRVDDAEHRQRAPGRPVDFCARSERDDMRDGSGWASTKFRTAMPKHSMTGTPRQRAEDARQVRPMRGPGMDKMTPTTAAVGVSQFQPYQQRKVGHAPECETAHCRIAAARRRARGVRIDELGSLWCAAGRSGTRSGPRVLLRLAVRGLDAHGLDAHGLAVRGLDA